MTVVIKCVEEPLVSGSPDLSLGGDSKTADSLTFCKLFEKKKKRTICGIGLFLQITPASLQKTRLLLAVR